MTFVTVANSNISVSQSGIVYVRPGLAFCLQCIENVGFPQSEIFYLLNNGQINFRDPQLSLDDSRLCFSGITTSYNGTYSCTAVNNVGTHKAYVQIAVGGKRVRALHVGHAFYSFIL